MNTSVKKTNPKRVPGTQDRTFENSADRIIKTWLSEMKGIVGPSKIKDQEIEQKITGHMNKCRLVVDNFRTKSMFFLLDNSNLRYLFVSASVTSVLGYTRDEVVEKGFEWLFTLFSDAELIYKRAAMNDAYGFLKTITRRQVLSCTVRYDLVVSNSEGRKIHLLEEMMFPEVNDSNEPIITTCFLHDIGNYGSTDARQCNIYLDDAQQPIFSRSYIVADKNSVPLSNRELQIVEQFSNGLTTVQVAKRLFVSENTIKTHRKNILLKLKVENTAEAVKTCVKNKWIR